MNFQGLSVGYQNIHGLHDKIGCKVERLEIDLKHDIEIWTETWGCNCTFEFEGYNFYYYYFFV